MISGTVNARREAIVQLVVSGPEGKSRPIRGAIDTAYNGSLTLPPSFITALNLNFDGTREVKLGDGTRRACAFYRGTITWGGAQRVVAVLQVEGQPLVGTKLLDGHLMAIEYATGGSVTLTPLPSSPGTDAASGAA